MKINNILIIGYGKMGKWLAETLSDNHSVQVYDRFLPKMEDHKPFQLIKSIKETGINQPELVINAVNIEATKAAFEAVRPYLGEDTILSDITSVKTDLEEYYKNTGMRYVSTHPMFGPTFADLNELASENAIIIKGSDEEGTLFFKEFYQSLGLNIHYTTFEEHDKMMAESLTLPFLTSFIFGTCTSIEGVPGTTYQKHQKILKGLLQEDNSLLSEVLFNQHSLSQIKTMKEALNQLEQIVQNNDHIKMLGFLYELKNRNNQKMQTREIGISK